MQVSVTFRHMPVSDPLREYATQKVKHAVGKYFRLAEVEAHIVMSVEKFWHIVDYTIGLGGTTVKVEERSEDMYSSIDLAMDKVERQVRRYKERLREHKPGDLPVLEIPPDADDVLDDDDELGYESV